MKDIPEKQSPAAVSPMKYTVRQITLTALLMAVNIGLASFSIPVPGGHLYLCDISVVAAALLLDPPAAFIAAGAGSFLGDFFFYPVTMFVSLFVHGFQAAIISVFARRLFRSRQALSAALGIFLGAVFMVIGYSLARAYLYSTPAYAWLKLPYEILQAVMGAVIAPFLVYRRKLGVLAESLLRH